jgi:hypothetical protein
VTNDVSAAVKAVKSGRADFKVDKTAIVHVGLGKVCNNSINPIVPVMLCHVCCLTFLQFLLFAGELS